MAFQDLPEATVSVDGDEIAKRGQAVKDPHLSAPASEERAERAGRKQGEQEQEEDVDGLETGEDGVVRGRLSSTNSHLLRLTLPLPSASRPVAFVLHPSQPLSYLARLIAAEQPAGSIGSVEFHGLGKQGELRWSESTDIGDFVVQAAQVKSFRISLKPPADAEEGTEEGVGKGKTMEVVVPSFEERTKYLVQRLGRVNEQLRILGDEKEECDADARRGARRMAALGLGGLLGYWVVVFRLTFWDLGWDIMEPATYLVGHGVLISGYCYWLYHQRQPNYDAVLDKSVSSRQAKLYRERGFDLDRHRALSSEGLHLRDEIRKVAREYGIDWHEDLAHSIREVKDNRELEKRSKREGKSKEEYKREEKVKKELEGVEGKKERKERGKDEERRRERD